MKREYWDLKVYNIADWVSFFRIIVTPVIFYFIFSNQKVIFTALLAASFISDAVDGILARRLKIESERGAFLDSLGDILLLMTAVAGVFWFEGGVIRENLWPVALVFGLYGLLSVVVYVKFRRPSSFHTYLAKATFVLLAFFFLHLFIFGFSQWFFYLVVVVSILELLEEMIIAFLLPRLHSNVRGVGWILKNRDFYLK